MKPCFGQVRPTCQYLARFGQNCVTRWPLLADLALFGPAPARIGQHLASDSCCPIRAESWSGICQPLANYGPTLTDFGPGSARVSLTKLWPIWPTPVEHSVQFWPDLARHGRIRAKFGHTVANVYCGPKWIDIGRRRPGVSARCGRFWAEPRAFFGVLGQPSATSNIARSRSLEFP